MASSKKVLESIDSNTFLTNKRSKTIRLTVDLKNTDENGCPVFNYQELLKAEKKRLKELANKPKEINGDNINNEDEETLKKVASLYEEKYGSRSRVRYQTYTELGAGYDETDSFIDNTEACEEGLPDDIEPIRGGFYVNSGKLEHKRLNSSDSRKNKKKRLLDSGPDNDNNSSDDKKNQNDRFDDSENKISNKKDNKVKKLLQIKNTEEVFETNLPSNDRKKSRNSETNVEKLLSDVKSNDQPLNPDTKKYSNDQIECSDRLEIDSADTAVSGVSCSEASNSTDVEVFQKAEPPKLTDIPLKIEKIIIELLKIVSNNRLSHTKMFTESTHSLVYELESTCRKELQSSTKQEIYKYLAYFIPCNKSTLISRIKKIYLDIQQLESNITGIKNILNSYDKIHLNFEQQRQSLQEIKPLLEKIVNIKIRHYISIPKKERGFLSTYILEYLHTLVPLWSSSTVTPEILFALVREAVQTEAELFNLDLNLPEEFEIIDTQKSINIDDITTPILKKPIDDEILTGNKTPSSYISEIDNIITKEINGKNKDETISNKIIIKEHDTNLQLFTKLPHKKQKCLSIKKELIKTVGKIDGRCLLDNKDVEIIENNTAIKYCSADEKVQMQLDQVMQDLVVLNQMSSDTCSNK